MPARVEEVGVHVDHVFAYSDVKNAVSLVWTVHHIYIYIYYI